jgi:hypothetical protein
MSDTDDKRRAPFVEIVSGNPNAGEIAAIVAVLGGALNSQRGVGDTPPRNTWGPARERMRPQYFNGANAYTSLTPLFWTSGS